MKGFLYKLLKISNDLNAISRGPKAMGRRAVRRSAGKVVGRQVFRRIR